MKLKQEVAAAAAATCWQGSDCRNNAHTVMSILNTIQKNILAYEFRLRMTRQVPAKKLRDHICSSKRE